MRFVVRNDSGINCDLSIVLLDWSCRESLHILDYLSRQSVDRSRYEIIWIEFYDRPSQKLCERIARAQSAQTALPVDTYAVMGLDKSLCYHKHLMMNLGILLARGRIVCLADSDAIVEPTFVESVITSFRQNGDIVLHLDEVRNNDADFYPFFNPALDDVTGFGCINWLNGRPTGLLDKADPLHSRNYGACMCATRKDLIAIGGADMHIDYVGHIAGPYEMTWRLINAGKRELWHESEWLYHVWHPGQAGDDNLAGPHDGMHISTRALQSRTSGRVLPYVESAAMTMLRTTDGLVDEASLLNALVNSGWLEQWRSDRLKTSICLADVGSHRIKLRQHNGSNDLCPLLQAVEKPLFGHAPTRLIKLRHLPTAVKLAWRQFKVKHRAGRWSRPKMPIHDGREWRRKLTALKRFAKLITEFNRYRFKQCWRALAYAAQEGRTRLVVYGQSDAAEILCSLSRSLPVSIVGICPFEHGSSRRLFGRPVISEDKLPEADGVILAAFVDIPSHLERLGELNLPRHAIITLQ